MYKPNPMDTSGVTLPEELLALAEAIASNVHENWARGRMAEGWVYGEKRDDIKRETPCLVPYDALPEEEKEYDRVTAMETLKMIVAMGFQITKQ